MYGMYLMRLAVFQALPHAHYETAAAGMAASPVPVMF